jgi:hypothetical protein
MRRPAVWLGVAIALTAAAAAHQGHGRRYWYPSFVALAGGQSHQQVVARLGPSYRSVLRADVVRAGGRYPPDRLRLIGLKQERVLEVWIPVAQGWTRLRSYRVLAASGEPGPKLRQGDHQVPEGLYRLTGFNPNSSYHLSVRVDYPNQDDRKAAAAEGRVDLGGDIFIHGKAVSIGCLAIGDRAIEELYLLLGDTGLRNSTVLLSPNADPNAPAGAPQWLRQLYERIRADLMTVRGPVPAPVETSEAQRHRGAAPSPWRSAWSRHTG